MSHWRKTDELEILKKSWIFQDDLQFDDHVTYWLMVNSSELF